MMSIFFLLSFAIIIKLVGYDVQCQDNVTLPPQKTTKNKTNPNKNTLQE